MASSLLYRTALCATLLPFFTATGARAQADLFGTAGDPVRSGVVLGINGSAELPGGDMADRFGPGYRVGPSVHFKTKTNWFIGAKFDFLFMGQPKEDSLLYNVRDEEGFFINTSGRREQIEVAGRGYVVGLQLGRFVPLTKGSTVKNLLFTAGAGFMQHKILINDKEGTIPQVKGAYRKGYDRLANGVYGEVSAAYAHFSKQGFANFYIGLQMLAGFNAGRRDFLFDVMRPGTDSRVDLLFGLKGGWLLPVFKRASEETFYE